MDTKTKTVLSKEQNGNKNAVAGIVFSFPIKFLAALPPREGEREGKNCRRAPFNLLNNLDPLSHFLVIRFGSGKNNRGSVKRDTYSVTGTAARELGREGGREGGRKVKFLAKLRYKKD